MKNQTGIWLDQKQAFIIQIDKEEASVQQLDSKIEDFHVVGGARSKTPYGPMDVVSEKKSLERNKHQMNNYFKEIRKVVKGSEELYLFGPADTKFKLREAIQNDNALSCVVRKTDTADSMTEGQMVAQVREAFKMKSAKG